MALISSASGFSVVVSPGGDDRDAEAREGLGGRGAGLGLARDLAAIGQHRRPADGAERGERGGISLAHTGGCDCCAGHVRAG